MYDFNQAIIFLVPDSTISVRNILHNDCPFSVLNTTKTLFQIMSLAAYTSKTNNSGAPRAREARVWAEPHC